MSRIDAEWRSLPVIQIVSGNVETLKQVDGLFKLILNLIAI